MNILRSSKLDVLRVLLCCCVLICHLTPSHHALAGHVGVLGFFCLSGYLLQASFYRMEREFNVERFFRSKARKLLPAYLCAFVMGLIVPLYSTVVGFRSFLPPVADCRYTIFKYVSFYNIPAWYMGCLFVFMLLAPFLWWLHCKRWGIPLLAVLAWAFTSFLYWRHDGTAAVLMGAGSMNMEPQVRLWQFMAGMLAARVVHEVPFKFLTQGIRRWGALLALLMIVSVSTWISVCYHRGNDLANCYWFDILAVSMFSVIISLWDDRRGLPFRALEKWFAWLASLTYGVYLFHVPIYCLLEPIWSKLPMALNSYGLMIFFAVGLSVFSAISLNRFCALYWRKS